MLCLLWQLHSGECPDCDAAEHGWEEGLPQMTEQHW